MRKLGWLSLFSVSMAYVEAAVVVYLREIYYPGTLTSIFPLKTMSPLNFGVELGREPATLLMLASVAFLAERGKWRRFYAFLYVFGLWDIFYYLWLRLFIHWPGSLKDFDILFLIPVPWFGPVYAPVLAALVFILAGGYVLVKEEITPRPNLVSLACFLVGSAILFALFVFPSVELILTRGIEGFKGFVPGGFSLPLYLSGLGLLFSGIILPLRG